MLQAESSRGAVGGFQPLKLMKVCVYVCVCMEGPWSPLI